MEAITFLVFSVICSIPILLTFIILLRSYLRYPSFYVLELLLSSLLLILWTLLGFPIYIAPELFSLSNESLVQLEHITTILGAFGTLFFIFVIGNSIPTRFSILPRLTVVCFSILIGMKLIQLFIPINATIYGFQETSNGLIRVTNLSTQIVVAAGFGLLIICIIIFTLKQLRLPSGFLPNKSKTLLKSGTVIFAIGLILNFIGTSVSDFNLSGLFLIVSRLLITISLIIIYQMFTQNSEIVFSERGNPLPFVERGIIGWVLAGNRTIGPEVLKDSEKFKNNYDIQDLTLLSAKLITSAGMGAEEFTEELIVIPLNNKLYPLTAIGFSFRYPDKIVTDPRKNGKSELVFAVIIPTFVLAHLEDLSFTAMYKPVSKYIRENEDLSNMIQRIDFSDLAVEIIRDISTKDFY